MKSLTLSQDSGPNSCRPPSQGGWCRLTYFPPWTDHPLVRSPFATTPLAVPNSPRCPDTCHLTRPSAPSPGHSSGPPFGPSSIPASRRCRYSSSPTPGPVYVSFFTYVLCRTLSFFVSSSPLPPWTPTTVLTSKSLNTVYVSHGDRGTSRCDVRVETDVG